MEKPTPLPSWLESHLIPDDWQRLKGLLDGYRVDNGLYRNIEAYADLAFDMFYIFPDKRQQLGLDEEFGDEYKAKFVNAQFISRKHYSSILKYLSNLKTFFPDDKYVDELAQPGKDILLKFALDEIKKNNMFLEGAFQYKILFRDFDFESQVDESKIKSIRSDIDNWMQNNSVQFRHYMSQDAAIKAVLPNTFNECGLAPNFWQSAAEELGKIREEKSERRMGGGDNSNINFANFGLQTQILYAKEIKFGDRGMELVMPNSQITPENVLPLPEARRY